MFGGVKITLILCLTMIVCCVLFVSYNEYTNRYSLITTSDNSLYIFDKKSSVLNRCDGETCRMIETKLPAKMTLGFEPSFQQSKLFDSERPMSHEVAKPIIKQDVDETTQKEEIKKKDVAEKTTDETKKEKPSEKSTATTKKTDEEFVE